MNIRQLTFAVMLGILSTSGAFASKENPGSSRIVVVVNKVAMTSADVEQRIRLINLSTGKAVNTPIPPDIRKKMVQGMVDESLQLQATKQMKIEVSDKEVDDSLSNLARENGMSLDGMVNMLKSNGIPKEVMMTRIRAQMAWGRFIREKYGHLVTVVDKDVDKLLARANNAKPEQPSQEMMDITLCQAIFPIKQDSAPEVIELIAPKIEEAQKAKGCQSFLKIARQGGARVDQNRVVKLGQLPNELKTLVNKTTPGTCMEPAMTPDGLAVTMICTKSMPKAAPIPELSRQDARQAVEQEQLGKKSAQEMARLKMAAYIEWKE
jgi:peptidyl-prolyl cis-trans isomerase SurA